MTDHLDGTDPAVEPVRRYLERLAAHDWSAVTECLSGDVIRVGPFADRYEGRDGYLAFLSALMPALPGYSLELGRILRVGAGPDREPRGATVLAELRETVEVDGAPLVTAEALVFELDEDRLISHIAIYIQRT